MNLFCGRFMMQVCLDVAIAFYANHRFLSLAEITVQESKTFSKPHAMERLK